MLDRSAAGRHAEDCAARALERRGAAILHRNYRRRTGELDLVALERGTLLIIEVRLRSRSDYGGAAASVDGIKQSRILRTTRQLLQQQRALRELPVRFDVAVVRPDSAPASDGGLEDARDWPVEWITHAFAAD